MVDNESKIRLGIVGCGSITAERHLPALKQIAEVDVVALADTDGATLEIVGTRCGVARRYAEYQGLVEDDRVNAVAVCVPPSLHAEIALAALAAGKHVFIEKPLALTLEECDLLLQRAAESDGLKVMVGFNLRWHRLVRKARKIIGSGELGEIKLVRTVFMSAISRGAEVPVWRTQRHSGGGALFEKGVHHFDLLWFLLGSGPAEIYTSTSTGDDTSTVVGHLESGAQVALTFSESTAENHELEIYGERGWLRVSCYRTDGFEQLRVGQYPGAISTRLRKLSRTLGELPRMIRQSRNGGDYVASYASEWEHFASAILSGTPIESTLSDGRRALAFALAAWEATEVGRAVKMNG